MLWALSPLQRRKKNLRKIFLTMDYLNIPSAMEALQNPLPKSFHVGAPYQNQIQQMEEQNKTAGTLVIILLVIASFAVIVLSASEARAWQKVSEGKS